MATIRVENLSKLYAPGLIGVADLSLEVHDSEIVVLVGPSGCGKTTTLRLIAGLDRPTAGRVLIGSADMTGCPAHRRNLAMVFQSPALYPHKNVQQNLEFSLRMRNATTTEIAERVRETTAMLGLQDLLHRKPAQLSGGERQLVALGRALVQRPNAFLFDEPFSNLDAHLRVQMRSLLGRVGRQLGIATIHVTHDQEEAMTLGDRVVVMNQGKLEQQGAPQALYDTPANRFVAGFIGSPAMNFFCCNAETVSDVTWLKNRSMKIALPEKVSVAGDVIVGVRPEHIDIVEDANADFFGIAMNVVSVGREHRVQFGDVPSVNGVLHVISQALQVQVGKRKGLQFRRSSIYLFSADTGKLLARDRLDL